MTRWEATPEILRAVRLDGRGQAATGRKRLTPVVVPKASRLSRPGSALPSACTTSVRRARAAAAVVVRGCGRRQWPVTVSSTRKVPGQLCREVLHAAQHDPSRGTKLA